MSAEDLHFSITGDNQDLITKLRDSRNAIKDSGDAVAKESERMEQWFKRVGLAAATYMSFDFAKGFAGQVIQVTGDMEALQQSFETLLGSKEKGLSMYNEIKEYAVKTPMQLEDLAKGAQTMLGFNIAADKVIPTLKQIGDISMGDADKFKSLVLAFSQMSATGRLMGQDLLQMINGGFNPLSVISEQTGKSIGQLKDEMEKGAISADMVADAFKSATDEGGKFHGMLESQSEKINGLVSTLKDKWKEMLGSIGTDNKDVIMGGLNLSFKAIEHYKELIDIIKVLVATYGAYKAALMVTYALQNAGTVIANVRAWMQLAATVRSAKDAQVAFNLATSANPWGAIAAGVALVVSSLILFVNTSTAAERAAEKLGEINKDASDGAKEEQNKIDALVATIRSEVSTREQKNAALKKLNDIMPDNLGYITEEAVRTGRATEAIDTYIRSVERQIKIDAIREEIKKSQQRVMSAGKDISLASTVWNTIKSGGNAAIGTAAAIADIVGSESQYQKSLMKDLKKLTEESIVIDNKAAQAKARTISVIDEEIKQKKEEQQSVAKTRKEYEAYEQQIKKLEAERDSISGGKTKKSKTVADGEAYREQLNKLNSEINKDKLSIMQDGADKEMQAIKTEYADKLNEIEKQEQSLLEAYNKSKGLKKGDKGYISQLPSEAQDSIDTLKQLAATVRDSKELKLLLGGNDELVLDTSMDGLLESTKTYEQKRLDIVGNAMKDIAELENAGAKKNAEVRREQMNQDLRNLAADYRENFEDRERIYDRSIYNITKKRYLFEADREKDILDIKLKGAKEAHEKLEETQKKSPTKELEEEIAIVRDRIKEMNEELGNIPTYKFQEALTGIKKITDELGGLGGEIGEIFSSIGRQLDNISIAFDKKANKFDKVAAGISGVVDLINVVGSASARRHQAENKFYQNKIALAHEYALGLNEILRTQAEFSGGGFLNDYSGKINKGFEALSGASKQYYDSLRKLSEGKAKVDLRNAVDWGSVGMGAASGAAAGAAIASVLPVIGTAVGGIVGGVVGGVVGLFGGKKKKDVTNGLLEVFPELVDGAGNLNQELARTLIATDQVDDKTKQLLQNSLDWAEAVEKANAQIKEVVVDLAGDLGNNLENAIVDAWKSGENASAKMFAAASESLGKFVEDLLYSTIFSDVFDEFSERMAASLSPNGDGDVVDDYDWLMDEMDKRDDDYMKLLDMIKERAKERGFDIGGNTGETADRSATAKGFNAMSQDTGNELNGRFTVIQGHTFEINGNVKAIMLNTDALLDNVIAIKGNTDRLEAIESHIRATKDGINDISLKGVKIKS